MSSIPGAEPSSPSELARVEDRITFVYLEHAVIARESNALTATGEDGIVHIPSAGLLVLMLGPGTNVTHQAMMVLSDSGAAIVWVGENGVRYYAGGRPLARSTRLLERQAAIVSNTRERMRVARRMYAMRFPDEDVAGLAMQQLRGREGARVRSVYRDWSKRTGVKWDRRDYDVDDFEGSDDINQALSAANTCLYGLVHAAAVALGCSAGLGIVHTGHDRSFVYDVADLYKAETSIPVSFETVALLRDAGGEEGALSGSDLAGAVRRKMRDRFVELKLVERIVADVKSLLLEHAEGVGFISDRHGSEHSTDLFLDEEMGGNELWDGRGTVPGGVDYSGESSGS
ncbi:type I-E CRISPR-associated endonuclease Cas1e [Leucobacter sp. wl10]|uniref:type I-E CRISPR-associated endonuclease Cas1e n=1 Tax=Leucobacter sp. wl10 TaxID=2304677 RepID=UPI000E5A9C80|nr:type I-E CRISPR-associated endonuclease Cas1e [Leucobacter sp. wl10]RGE19823.1 type I-E CRISPR-associated endonuclease Cas1 [Leucobacter sp. wl10]